MVLAADKGVALIIIDKDTYTEKGMALLNEKDVYHEYTDQTKSIQFKLITQLLDQKNSIAPKFKDQYIKPHPSVQLETAFPTDSMVYQKFIMPTSPSGLMYQHVTHPLTNETNP